MGHDNSSKNVKDRIILATIECIEKNGINSVTTRTIAKEADVNVAAINYYFGSKDKLLDEVFRSRLSHVFEEHMRDFFSEENTDTFESIKEYLTNTFQGIYNYPNFTKALLNDALMNNNYDNQVVKSITDFLGVIEQKIQDIVPDKKSTNIKMFVVQLWSTILVLGLLPDLFNNYIGGDFRNDENQNNYMNQLFKTFFDK